MDLDNFVQSDAEGSNAHTGKHFIKQLHDGSKNGRGEIHQG